MNQTKGVNVAGFLILLAVILLPSCRIFHSRPEIRGGPSYFYKDRLSSKAEKGESPEVEGEKHIVEPETFGVSVEGRPIKGYVLGDGEEVVLLLGGIQGDAPGGEILLQDLVDHFTSNPSIAKGLRLVIIPSCNPDGLEVEERFNANGVDLNLNFPLSETAPAEGSEPEIQAIMNALEAYPPHLAVSIQSPGGCINYAGPGAKELALKVSRACRLPLCRTESPPGSLGACLGQDHQVSVIIIELDYRHKRGVMSPFERERMTNTLLDLLEMD